MGDIAIIVAVAENGVIGSDNGLPWRIPADMRFFKNTTMGKPVIMGRKTWDSIGKPLPGRTNIVISRNRAFSARGAEVVTSLEDALTLGARAAAADGATEAVVIGGAQIYEAVIPRADRLYITEVHGRPEGDAHMPDIDWSRWREVEREYHAGELPDPDLHFSFVRYERAE